MPLLERLGIPRFWHKLTHYPAFALVDTWRRIVTSRALLTDLSLNTVSPQRSDVSSATSAVDVGRAGVLSDDRDIHGYMGAMALASSPWRRHVTVGKTLARLCPIRDKVLDHVGVTQRELLLDVGCGDGLIAFGALAMNPTIRVIFSDISQDLLDHATSLAHQMSVADRCECLCASADDLSALGDRSVDGVTVRSVLIYVADKRRAFQEFARVLRPGGRLSIFEPINRFGEP